MNTLACRISVRPLPLLTCLAVLATATTALARGSAVASVDTQCGELC
ncbi:MAG: hypothetical protein ACYDC1_18145 [Limisphaerales bacterium]